MTTLHTVCAFDQRTGQRSKLRTESGWRALQPDGYLLTHWHELCFSGFKGHSSTCRPVLNARSDWLVDCLVLNSSVFMRSRCTTLWVSGCRLTLTPSKDTEPFTVYCGWYFDGNDVFMPFGHFKLLQEMQIAAAESQTCKLKSHGASLVTSFAFHASLGFLPGKLFWIREVLQVSYCDRFYRLTSIMTKGCDTPSRRPAVCWCQDVRKCCHWSDACLRHFSWSKQNVKVQRTHKEALLVFDLQVVYKYGDRTL